MGLGVAIVSSSGTVKERKADLSEGRCADILIHAGSDGQLPKDTNKQREAFVNRIPTADVEGDRREGQLPY
jgi:hypothetical protein